MCFLQTEGKTSTSKEYDLPYHKTHFISVVWNQIFNISTSLYYELSLLEPNLSRNLQRPTCVDVVDTCWFTNLMNTITSLLWAWAQQSSISFVSQPSRANLMLTFPKTWIWNSEMKIRICSCRDQEHVCICGIVRFWTWLCEAGSSRRCSSLRYNSGASPSEKQNKTVWPQKREWEKRPAFSSWLQSLMRTIYTYSASSRNTPVCLYNYSFLA